MVKSDYSNVRFRREEHSTDSVGISFHTVVQSYEKKILRNRILAKRYYMCEDIYVRRGIINAAE